MDQKISDFERRMFAQLAARWPGAYGHLSVIHKNRWASGYVYAPSDACTAEDFERVASEARRIIENSEFAGCLCEPEPSIRTGTSGRHCYTFWLAKSPDTAPDFAAFKTERPL